MHMRGNKTHETLYECRNGLLRSRLSRQRCSHQHGLREHWHATPLFENDAQKKPWAAWLALIWAMTNSGALKMQESMLPSLSLAVNGEREARVPAHLKTLSIMRGPGDGSDDMLETSASGHLLKQGQPLARL